MKPKKTVAQISTDYRARWRAKGYEFVSVMVLKKNVAKIKAIEAADKASKKGE